MMRRLPTAVFVVAGVLLVVLGATWWMRSDPADAAARTEPPANGRTTVVRLDNGAVLTYRSRQWTRRSAVRYQELERLTTVAWPCRVGVPTPLLGNRWQSSDDIQPGDRVIRLPQCSEVARTLQGR
jgi:hypothetical protein